MPNQRDSYHSSWWWNHSSNWIVFPKIKVIIFQQKWKHHQTAISNVGSEQWCRELISDGNVDCNVLKKGNTFHDGSLTLSYMKFRYIPRKPWVSCLFQIRKPRWNGDDSFGFVWWTAKKTSQIHLLVSVYKQVMHMDVSKNSGTPKSSILYNRVFQYKPSILGTPIFRNTYMDILFFTNLGLLQKHGKISLGFCRKNPSRSRSWHHVNYAHVFLVVLFGWPPFSECL